MITAQRAVARLLVAPYPRPIEAGDLDGMVPGRSWKSLRTVLNAMVRQGYVESAGLRQGRARYRLTEAGCRKYGRPASAAETIAQYLGQGVREIGQGALGGYSRDTVRRAISQMTAEGNLEQAPHRSGRVFYRLTAQGRERYGHPGRFVHDVWPGTVYPYDERQALDHPAQGW